MKVARLSFALLLPALEIAVWLVLVPTQVGLIYWRLHHGALSFYWNPSDPSESQPQTGKLLIVPSPMPSAPKHPIFDFALRLGTAPHSHLVTAINLPGTLVEALISMPTSWPDLWYPSGLMKESWQAIILPFFCLPFWWFVGVGLDAAFARRRLRWWTLLLGSISCLLTATMLIGLRFGMSDFERSETVDWVFSGLVFWVAAFSVFPAAWILQRRRAKAAKSFALGAEENPALS